MTSPTPSLTSQPPETRSAHVPVLLAGLALFALAGRIALIWMLRSWEHPNAMEHHSIARFLLAGEGFTFIDFGHRGPSSVQSPTYPLLLAGLYHVFGVGSSAAYIAAMLINAVAGSLTVVLTYVLGRTLGAGRPASGLAAMACAIWPTQLYAVTHVQAVALITLCTAAIMILFERSVRSGQLRPWIAFSLIGCVAALTEPILLPPVMLAGLLVLAWPGLAKGIRLRNAGILLCTGLLVLGPWALRNRLVHGAWIPIKSTFWVNTWKGNNPHATGTDRLAIRDAQLAQLGSAGVLEAEAMARSTRFDALRQYDMLSPAQLDLLRGQPDMVREQIFKEWTTQWIRAHPGEYARLCMVRLAKTLWVDWDNPKTRNMVYIIPRTLLLVLSSVGLVMALRRGWPLLFPLCIVGTALVLISATITAARFSIPFEPLQFILVALVLWNLSRVRAQFTRSAAGRLAISAEEQ